MTNGFLRSCLLVAGATTLLHGAVVGQVSFFYAPSDTPTTGTCNVFPWGQSSTRHQHVVTAAELGNTAQNIVNIGYAACGTGTFTASQILIRMAHVAPGPLSTTFASNFATSPVTVLSANNWSYNYVTDAWADVGLGNSFGYDPALGDLLIDIEFCGATGGTSFHRDVAPRCWVNGGPCPSATTGTSATGGLKVRVTALPAGTNYFYAPSDTPTLGTCNVFPWGQTSSRHQHVVTAAELGNTAQSISDIGYAACANGTFTASQILIRMAHVAPGPLSTTFASNFATPPVTVLNSNNWSYNYTSGAWADVGLTGGFAYDPSLGDLLIDIEFCGASGGAAFHRDVAPRCWDNGGPCPSNPTGTSTTGALIVRVCTGTGGRYSSFGTGCGTPPLSLAGQGVPNIGSMSSVAMSNGPAGAVGAYGASFAPTNISLTPQGAPGCFLYTNPIVVALTGFDGAGNASPFNIALPADPGLVGLPIVHIGAAVDPPANQLGVTTSNGLTATIGF